MRRAWSRSASAVMVMRETSGFGATNGSESMLKAQRRGETTRARTPGLFSRRPQMCSSCWFTRRPPFPRWGWAAIFRAEAPAATIDRLCFLLYFSINQHGPFGGHLALSARPQAPALRLRCEYRRLPPAWRSRD